MNSQRTLIDYVLTKYSNDDDYCRMISSLVKDGILKSIAGISRVRLTILNKEEIVLESKYYVTNKPEGVAEFTKDLTQFIFTNEVASHIFAKRDLENITYRFTDRQGKVLCEHNHEALYQQAILDQL